MGKFVESFFRFFLLVLLKGALSLCLLEFKKGQQSSLLGLVN
jgi:hypothetical protein